MIEPVAQSRFEPQEFEPEVWRRITVLNSSTPSAFQDVIQVAVGPMDFHMRGFETHDQSYDDSMLSVDTYRVMFRKTRSLGPNTVFRLCVKRFPYFCGLRDYL